MSLPVAHQGAPLRPMSPQRRWTMSALTLVLLGGNAFVALQPPHLVRLGIGIPQPESLLRTFLLTNMFSTYAARNEDHLISGRRTQTGSAEDRGRWIPLPLGEHFPSRHTITAMQLYAPQHSRATDPLARSRAWAVMARKIRANHNRLHPERPVAQVRLGSVDWPLDSRGYRAGKVPSQLQHRTWFSEAR